jgi:membrane protease YdiL (CAAX protease family)
MKERAQSAWTKLPVVVRAILGGVAIVAVGVAPWSALAAANLHVASSFPWASIVGLTYLTLLWTWLGGRGWPRTTAEVRRRNLRANAVGGRLLLWTVISGTLFASGLIAVTVMGWMLAAVPASRLDEFTMLSAYPWWTTIPLLLTSSLVAGVVEEAAFRGYMQVPVERRHGPVVAIGVVAAVFTMAHLPSPIAWPGFVLAAMGWGVLAYLSGSILPGVVFHALVNASVWMWALLNRASLERVLAANALQEGPGSALGLSVGVTMTLATAAILAFVKLAKVRHAVGSSARPSPPSGAAS